MLHHLAIKFFLLLNPMKAPNHSRDPLCCLRHVAHGSRAVCADLSFPLCFESSLLATLRIYVYSFQCFNYDAKNLETSSLNPDTGNASA